MTDVEALKLIPFVRHSYNTKNFTKDSYTAEQWFGTVENALKQKAERRGRWIDIAHAPNGLLYATCSICGKRQTVESVAYCGNCGARMVEE